MSAGERVVIGLRCRKISKGACLRHTYTHYTRNRWSATNGNGGDLQVEDFGFNVPSNALICGVEVKIKREANSVATVALIGEVGAKDDNIQLLVKGTPIGVNAAKNNVWKPNESNSYTTYGSSSSNWGTFLTPADVNDPEFGVSVSVKFTGLANVLPSASIDHIEMAVSYQIPVVLPITLSDFQAEAQNEKVDLEWSFASTEPGSVVTLQRSSETGVWQNIYAQLLADNVRSTQFSYSDKPQQAALYLYRLKMTTLNGNATYSKEIKVDRRQLFQNNITLKQNGSQLMIVHPAAITKVQVFSNNGQPVKVPVYKTAEGSLLEITQLPTGLYLIRCGNTSLKFVKR